MLEMSQVLIGLPLSIIYSQYMMKDAMESSGKEKGNRVIHSLEKTLQHAETES